ncbi:hypothetical protein [Herbidospora sp. NBRC 101105]|uniref:hypothetical protein n=1 Tax=Herbidospora sp. NBRC 101105 TaxID=3032195 RepID=UPI0024A41DD2|nr:hypothetical protein [Herbidospora sp. NBRC 101105]GLX94967.1 hypothetical protein Hesp01_29170 [Herbidospora sp. NBRC 101105]
MLLPVPALTCRADAKPEGQIGIRLVEAPEDRADDPRARAYIVDHVTPGTVIHRRIAVNNTSAKPRTLWLYAAGAEIKNRKFGFLPDQTANELSSWIVFDHPAVTLPPGGERVLRATIRVPRTAWKGERYAVMWAEARAPATEERNVQVNNRVGIRVYLDVGPGGEPPTDFRVDRIWAGRDAAGRPRLEAQVTNTGLRAVDVSGELRLSEGPGGTSAGPFKVTGGVTMAPDDVGRVEVLLDPSLPLGPWRADLELTSGRTTRTASGTVRFPAAPDTTAAVKLSRTAFLSPTVLLTGTGALAVAGGGYLIWRRARRTP